jgi:hypothetical protein
MAAKREPVPEPSVRARLEAVRDRLALAIGEADPKELPALSREYRATLAEIEALPKEKGSATVDQLKERRAARRAAATDRAHTAEQ